MGLILKRNVDDDCLLGIWEITENYDSLYSKIKLLPEDQTTLDSFQNYKRKLEWLSVRVLINILLEKECYIVYNEQHKPFLSDNSYNISISHSKNLTSILVSTKKRVGIDLEYMSHKIHNIAHKFINYDEVLSKDPSQHRLHLYIHWCAKEAIYKICDKQDINFKENLTIQPFEISHEGELEGLLHNRHGNENFKLRYFLIDGYVVVWCNK
jgi:4'-phosphopantetheinyl transferase EntD